MLSFQELKKKLIKNIAGMPILKVALLGDSMTQFLNVALRGTAIDRGYSLNIFEANYNQVQMQVQNPDSELHRFQPDFVIVFQSTHKLLEEYSLSEPEKRIILFERRLAFIDSLTKILQSEIIYFNYTEIDDTVFGNFANAQPESFLYLLRKLNCSLMDISVKNRRFHVCDVSSIQNKFGRNFMYPASIYMTTEMLLSLDCLPFIASRVMDIICAIKGSLKKCLILDLDNTLWGGVIGDDGCENIQIGHGLGIGKAFTEFQQWIKKLQQRGIILAICSKNTEAIAKEPFEKHPEMILRLSDIAIFVANWESKIDNIRYIQKILNISFDSMVFLDDNSYERNIIKENIPEITVPELPSDPADYIEYLYSLNLFETISFSAEDVERTHQYQIEKQRTAMQNSFGSETDFLKNLKMVSAVEEPNSFNIPRIAQLSQRSNQFNLRTIRYSEDDVWHIASNKDNYHCISFTLQDKFGDNGLICVVTLKKTAIDSMFIDNWFMSCRVLNRGMENFVLNTIVFNAKAAGFSYIVGEYLPTKKNAIVSELYKKLGFMFMSDNNMNKFMLNLNDYKERETYIISLKHQVEI
jgi:FkbH-like protein